MKIDKEDERLYLQFLQNNIARMNSNSAQAKGWCIAIVAALLAIFSETKNELFVWICLIPVVLFCILDAHELRLHVGLIPVVLFCILDTLYLQQEHKFVAMYNDYVDNKAGKPQVYKMPMNAYEKGLCGFMKALVSWSVIIPYGLLLTAIVVILVQ